MDNLDTFEVVLSQYAESSHPSNVATTPTYVSHIDEHASKELADYCRRFVLVDKDSVEVVGEFDRKMSVRKILQYGNAVMRKVQSPSKFPEGKWSTMIILFSSLCVQYHQIGETGSQNPLSS
ncbi:hypothetical protein ARMSODRAFT_556600 [Armillaria solidipes]|uniref:Uncharacterized protein n=1 Tax=Armillaria solidipes TaxID=1076256 RepID=A0A2H3BGC5_9AGAR|nr:hypothetical protein ARMSODRAFT_556600 [Armillaria solidipes]